MSMRTKDLQLSLSEEGIFLCVSQLSRIRKYLEFGDRVVEVFKGKLNYLRQFRDSYCLPGSLSGGYCSIIDNDVDGEVFMMLEDNDITEMVPSIGARRKLILKRNGISKVGTISQSMNILLQCGPLLYEINLATCSYIFSLLCFRVQLWLKLTLNG